MPSRFFRYVSAFLCLLAPAVAQAQFGGPGGMGNPAYRQMTPEDAQKLIEGFRGYKLEGGDFCFEFSILHQPRRGDEKDTYSGTLWGTWNEKGPLLRVELKKDNDNTSPTRRFILQSGPAPELWIVGADGKPVRSTDDTLKPLFAGLIFTPFELQTPFTYWSDYKYVETRGYKGRPTHTYNMLPPADFKTKHPEIGYVKLSFDRGYNALMQAVVYDASNGALRQLEAESFSKVQEQYIPQEIRLRDEKTRDKDVMKVTAAVLKLALPKSVFDPATLTGSAPKPKTESFTKLD